MTFAKTLSINMFYKVINNFIRYIFIVISITKQNISKRMSVNN